MQPTPTPPKTENDGTIFVVLHREPITHYNTYSSREAFEREEMLTAKPQGVSQEGTRIVYRLPLRDNKNTLFINDVLKSHILKQY